MRGDSKARRLRGLVSTVAILASLAAPAARAEQESGKTFFDNVQARLAKGDVRGAEIELRNAERANPGDPAIHIELARLYLAINNLPSAEAEARLARQNKGDPSSVDPLLAQALSAQGKFNELFRDIMPGNRASQSESQLQVTLGLAHLQLKELGQAEPLLREAEQLDEKSAAAKAAMAQLLLAKSDPAGAQKEIAAAVAIAPDDLVVERVNALVLGARGDTAASVKALDALLAKHPDDIVGLSMRADALMRDNKLAAAKKDLDHALKLAPDRRGLIFLDGIVLAREGKLAEADAELSKASAGFNDIPYGYYLQGILKYRLRQFEQASDSLSKYLGRFPQDVGARRILADIYLLKRDYSMAITTLKPSPDVDPTDSASELLLARAYLGSGRRNDALDLYARAAKANPENAGSAAELGALETGLGQVQQGLAELDKLAETASGLAAAGPTLIVADLNSGRIADADKTAEAMVKRNGKDPVALSLLATVRMAEGNYADAAAIYKGMVDRDSTLVVPRRGLAQADFDLGKYDDAQAIMEAVVKERPNSRDDEIALAKIYARQGNIVAAADELRTLQKNLPNTPAAGIALLQIYGDAKHWDDARAYAHDLKGMFPGNTAVIRAIAVLNVQAGDLKLAASEFANMVQAAPASAPLLVEYAHYQLAAGDKAGALASLKKAITLAPKELGPVISLVNFERTEYGPEEALAAAQSIAKDHPGTAKLLSADILLSQGRKDEAIKLIADEQEAHPSDVMAAKLGALLYAVGDRDKAKQVLMDWTGKHANDMASRLMLAQIYDSDHDQDSARVLYEEIHEREPNNVAVLNSLAVIYGTKHDARALDYAAQAYRVDPNPHVADTFGWSLTEAGELKVALPILRSASADLPQDPTVTYHLAATLDALGQKDEARALLDPLLKSGKAFDERADAERLVAAGVERGAAGGAGPIKRSGP
jgi:putative PEP-CTERM system TPR-repeat lipoprotein